MKLFDDLRFVGTEGRLKIYGDAVWHCTSSAHIFGTNDRVFVVQKPYFYNGTFMGYTNLDQEVLTEDQLVANFKIVQEDGSLKDILHSKDNKKLQEELSAVDKWFADKSDEEIAEMLNKFGGETSE